MQWPKASIVIPVRDAQSLIGDALDAVAVQEYEGEYEVIVVDNGSLDDTAAVAERHPLAPRVIRRVRGEGPGAARNDGVAASSGEVIAFTDSDCRPTPGWLAAGVRALDGIALVQGAVLPPPGEAFGPFDHTLGVQSEYGLYETANMFVTREWFDRVGGFEDFIRAGGGRPFGEDAWFGWRVRRGGGGTAFAQDALVHHAVIPGHVRPWVREFARRRHFPELTRRIPELRDVFLFRRVFLNRRTARFDLALLGLAAFAVTRRVPALALGLPYAHAVYREVRNWPQEDTATVLAAGLVSDAVGAGALMIGSIRSKSPVL